jgi:lipocalin-like protein
LKIRLNQITAVIATCIPAFAMLSASESLAAKTHTTDSRVTTVSLIGTWTLTAADDFLPDGSRVHAYGASPQGLLIFAADGRYALQIYREDRAKFSSGDKKKGSLDEYKDASVGASCHFGHYSVDTGKGTITFKIDRASFANWDGAIQTRPFTIKGDDLEWRVPATPDGRIPISAWHRVR